MTARFSERESGGFIFVKKLDKKYFRVRIRLLEYIKLFHFKIHYYGKEN